MATKNKTIINKVTKEKITWLQTGSDTNGKKLSFLFEVAPGGYLPVTHFHPEQSETFEISKGTFKVILPDGMYNLIAGDKLIIPKGVPHKWQNDSLKDSAQLTITFEPALNTEIFLEQFYGLSNDGKTNKNGSPAFLQLMLWVNYYQVFIEGPPVFIQKILGYVLGAVARFIGYKNYYPQYSK